MNMNEQEFASPELTGNETAKLVQAMNAFAKRSAELAFAAGFFSGMFVMALLMLGLAVSR